LNILNNIKAWGPVVYLTTVAAKNAPKKVNLPAAINTNTL